MRPLVSSRALLAIIVTALVATACGSSSPEQATSSSASAAVSAETETTNPPPPKPTESTQLGPVGREAQLVAPDTVGAPAPLLVVLHGFGSDPEETDNFFGVTEQAADRGLYVLLPSGTAEDSGRLFWDAHAGCCNETDTPVDDLGYLRELIEEALEERPIDPDRVYVMGYSNGGFMAYRMACDATDLLAAVVVVAGADTPTAEECAPSRPVSVLHLHGDADRKVKYIGGNYAAPYPGAAESVARWADRNGCGGTTVPADSVDLDDELAGDETVVARYEGCPAGIDVQLNTIEGAEHEPAFSRQQLGAHVYDWLLAHSAASS